jgi:PQQ-dependent dehydrogenase (methanol/ethanol family)
MSSTTLPWVAGILMITMLCPPASVAEPPLTERFTSVDDEVALNPSPNDWLMWRRTYDSRGYSPLDQINKRNIGSLQLAWAWTQELGNQEAAPLVHDGIMYLAQSNNVVHALDAKTGNLIWEYRHSVPKLQGSYVRRQLVRARNSIALYGDKLFLASGDARLVALDARSGKVVWNVPVADYNVGFNYTAGPLVVRGKVIAGISGCTTPDTGGGCFLTAHDSETGKELWRTYSIARPGDPADASWNGIPLEQRKGGSFWGTGSYDPELNLIFWGTAPPIPHSELARGTGPGAHLYTNSTLAVDPDTGKVVWHFQHLPGDNWNLDHAFERVLVDLESGGGGERKSMLLTAGKTSIVWALDRKTGKYLWHRETVHQNVISNIDPKTGQVTLNRDVVPTRLGQDLFVCPSLYGGRIWQASAYSPSVKALFMPLANMCNDYKVVEQPPTPGEDYGRGRFTPRHAPGNNGMVGRVEAIDVRTGKSLWKHERRAIISSGLLATGGGLVIGGDGGRRAFALDADTGAVLWELPLNSSVGGFPMTYMVDGTQYLAIPTGSNILPQFSAPLTPESIAPADRQEGRGSTLMVFKLTKTQ